MKVKNGSHVQVHYKGILSDGTEFDNSHNRGWPLSFEVGSGQMINGFDTACVGMSKGQKKTVNISPADAYGERNPDALQPVPKAAFGPDFDFEVGAAVQGNGPRGPFLAKIHALEEEEVVLDLNHPLAGEKLQFEIEMVGIDEAPPPRTSIESAVDTATPTWNKSMKKSELYQIAKQRGISANSKTTKAQLIAALQET
jgi:FKBP-type peptidyl-prolyl cis-trans isomerase 2